MLWYALFRFAVMAFPLNFPSRFHIELFVLICNKDSKSIWMNAARKNTTSLRIRCKENLGYILLSSSFSKKRNK